MTITIGMIGSHSAEEIGVAAKLMGLKTVVFCQKGREKLYATYNKHLYDHIIIVDKFSDILEPKHTKKLQDLNTVIIPNRSLTSYLGYDGFEKWDVPIYGNRLLQRIEDRDFERNQYWLMKQVGIRYPKQFTKDNVDTLSIVKVQQKHKPLERAFFYVSSPDEFQQEAEHLIKLDLVNEQDLQHPVIEEFVLGPRYNANYHAYANPEYFDTEFEFVGFDDRVQANLQGILNLPASVQHSIKIPITNEEIGHRPVTLRESKKAHVYNVAEQFLEGVKKHFPPRMIGMFALQGAFNDQNEFVIFDISPRVPGAPILASTSPEMKRLSLKYQEEITTPLQFTMMELKRADAENKIDSITT